jgi:hypothetical protein
VKIAPPLLLLLAASALGAVLLWRILRRAPRKPVLVGVHLLLGIAGMEATALLLRGAPDGSATAAGSFGRSAGLMLILALMSGLASPMVARHWPGRAGNVALGTHVGIAAIAFALFVVWLLGA